MLHDKTQNIIHTVYVVTSGTSLFFFFSLMMEVFDSDEIGKEEIVVDGKDSKQTEKGADEG